MVYPEGDEFCMIFVVGMYDQVCTYLIHRQNHLIQDNVRQVKVVEVVLNKFPNELKVFSGAVYPDGVIHLQ